MPVADALHTWVIPQIVPADVQRDAGGIILNQLGGILHQIRLGLGRAELRCVCLHGACCLWGGRL